MGLGRRGGGGDSGPEGMGVVGSQTNGGQGARVRGGRRSLGELCGAVEGQACTAARKGIREERKNKHPQRRGPVLLRKR